MALFLLLAHGGGSTAWGCPRGNPGGRTRQLLVCCLPHPLSSIERNICVLQVCHVRVRCPLTSQTHCGICEAPRSVIRLAPVSFVSGLIWAQLLCFGRCRSDSRACSCLRRPHLCHSTSCWPHGALCATRTCGPYVPKMDPWSPVVIMGKQWMGSLLCQTAVCI